MSKGAWGTFAQRKIAECGCRHRGWTLAPRENCGEFEGLRNCANCRFTAGWPRASHLLPLLQRDVVSVKWANTGKTRKHQMKDYGFPGVLQFLPNLKWKSLSRVWLFATSWAIQSMAFSRPEYWSGVAFPFSRGSSQPRDQTQVSHIAGGFFTSWATREAQEYWSGVAFPFSSGSSWPRNGTGVSCVTGELFTSWAVREA